MYNSVHRISELYDRGNIVLTDYEYMVLNILRPRTDQDADVRYAVHEKYPLFMAKEVEALPDEKTVRDWFAAIKGKEQLKKVIGSHLFFGSALVEHALLTVGLTGNQKVSKDSADMETIIPRTLQALQVADAIYKEAAVNVSKGTRYVLDTDVGAWLILRNTYYCLLFNVTILA